MITATFFKDVHGIWRGFSLIGHAGYAEYGSDIVCASVSALAINTVNSIEAFTNDKALTNVEEETGLLTFSFSDSNVSEKGQLFIESLILGLKGICEEYNNDDYLKILFKEV